MRQRVHCRVRGKSVENAFYRVTSAFVSEDGIEKVTLNRQALGAGDGQFAVRRRGLAAVGNATVVARQIRSQPPGTGRAVRRAKRDLPALQVRLENNHPRL